MVYYEMIEEIYRIEIGRSEVENDELIKKAQQNSIWFHVKDMPSPHGILSFPIGTVLNKSVIVHIAGLVKGFSKAKSYSKVSVQYTEIKNVKRTSKPGLVILKKTPKIIVV